MARLKVAELAKFTKHTLTLRTSPMKHTTLRVSLQEPQQQ